MSIKPPRYEPIGAFCSLESASAAAQMSLAGGKVKPGWALGIFGSDADGWELIQYPIGRGEVSDLVERLRRTADNDRETYRYQGGGGKTPMLCEQAADRIQKLEKALREIADCISHHEGDVVDVARKALEE